MSKKWQITVCEVCNNIVPVGHVTNHPITCPFCNKPTLKYTGEQIESSDPVKIIEPSVPNIGDKTITTTPVAETTKEPPIVKKALPLFTTKVKENEEKKKNENVKPVLKKKSKKIVARRIKGDRIAELAEKVPEIFEMNTEKKMSAGQIALEMGCAASTISRILDHQWRPDLVNYSRFPKKIKMSGRKGNGKK